MKEKYLALPMNQVSTNATQGSYRPYFFDLAKFNLTRADYNSIYFENGEAELTLLNSNFSFCYLREDKLRTIDIYDKDGKIPFDQFLQRVGISIKSTNLFKSGKYLSRVFRSVKYGGFFSGIDAFLNHSYEGKVTDGISLVSVDLAKRLGWSNAKENQSAQFTFFYDKGLVKGHCVLSSKIDHDIIIYGEDNIKNEITLNNGLQYVTLEPVKLGKTLRMDIQSMLNLWQLFGADQYLEWTYKGIVQYEEDLFNGKLTDWLDDFEDISVEDYNSEEWALRKAIWRKIDYTKYPGLIRIAWRMFRQSLIRFAEKKNGNPSFRIPVPGGKRGYLRVDLRNHDKDGNFKSNLNRGEVCLDNYGNLWIHPDDTEEFLEVKGGADMDDNAAIIPVEENRAVIYRNPNQYGEYGIHKILYDGVEVKEVNKLIGEIPLRRKEKIKEAKKEAIKTGNKLLDKFLMSHSKEEKYFIPYTIENLLRTLMKISQNSANIGIAANAEMIKSVAGITSERTFKKLNKLYSWNLERIIDATVKEGIDAAEDMAKVRELITYIIENKVEMPRSIVHRFSEKLQSEVKEAKNHPLDNLFEAIKYLITEADVEVLGKGSVSKGNRIPGRIDRTDTPVKHIGINNIDNPFFEVSVNLLKVYNREIAILMDKTKEFPLFEQEEIRKAEIERIQSELLENLKSFSNDERRLIVKSWAYEIYKSERFIHDSILWIGNLGGKRGTAEDTIDMLADLGMAYQVKKNGTVERFKELRHPKTDTFPIRVWSKSEIDNAKYKSSREIIVENRAVLIDSDVFSLGDEVKLKDGIYSIKASEVSVSRKTHRRLKNSLTLYISGYNS